MAKSLQITFIRTGALGDILVTLPALYECQNKFPEARIWVMGSQLWRAVLDLKLWPKVNGFIEVDKKAKSAQLFVVERNAFVKVGEEQLVEYFLSQTDISIDLRMESIRFGIKAYKAKVPIRYGSCPFLLKHIYTHWSPYMGLAPVIHERDRLLRVLQAERRGFWPLMTVALSKKELRIEQTGTSNYPNFFSVKQPYPNQETLLHKWQSRGLMQLRKKVKPPLLKTSKYVLLNPTASQDKKAWPKKKFKELADLLKKNLRFPVYVIGAPNETEWLEEVASSKLKIIQPKDLEALISIVTKASALITNTSSMQYIACCQKTPCFTLMGRTFPARWGPLGPRDGFLAGKVPENFKGSIFDEDYACYDSISVEDAFSNIESWLSSLKLN